MAHKSPDTTAAVAVRNRVKELRYVRAGDLLPNVLNARTHPSQQQSVLKDMLEDVGIADGLIAYESAREGGALTLIDGHLRADVAPDTVWPVLVLDVDDAEATRLLATMDPISAMATVDAERLGALIAGVQSESEAVNSLLREMADAAGISLSVEPVIDPYSRKIEPPIYEPTGEKPPVSALYDDSKTTALCAAIAAADDLSDEQRRFLRAAAQRHTVLHFKQIAEYYAHADAGLQSLMEDSALVIIDFNRAIELGFVQMTQEIAEQVRDEYED